MGVSQKSRPIKINCKSRNVLIVAYKAYASQYWADKISKQVASDPDENKTELYHVVTIIGFD